MGQAPGQKGPSAPALPVGAVLVLALLAALFVALIIAAAVGLAAERVYALQAAAGIDWPAPPQEKARKSPVPPSAEVLKRGRALFVQQCALCHGEGGKGDGPMARLHAARSSEPPRDLTDPKIQERLTEGEVFWKISTGLRRGDKVIMPSFAEAIPSSQDRWSVALFVRSLVRPAS